MDDGVIGISRLTLDALKPREVYITDLALALGELRGIENVDIHVTEVDAKTETLKITLTGKGISMEEVEELLEKYSTVIRSIDAVRVSKFNVEGGLPYEEP